MTPYSDVLKQFRKAAYEWDNSGRQWHDLWLGDRGSQLQSVLDRLKPDLNDVERDFANAEALKLVAEIEDNRTSHIRRASISVRLHQLRHHLAGAGLQANGMPDIEWCYVDVPEKFRDTPVPLSGHIFKSHEKSFMPINIESVLRPFYISKYPITFTQYQAFMEHPDGFDNTNWWHEIYYKACMRYHSTRFKPTYPYVNFPRDRVTWNQAIAFCKWMTVAHGEVIRLPTIQEWLWVAQNGTEATKYSWGNQWNSEYRFFAHRSSDRITAVGMYPQGATSHGVHDMGGNLMEWCMNKQGNIFDTSIDNGWYHRCVAFKRATKDDSCLFHYNEGASGPSGLGFRCIRYA